MNIFASLLVPFFTLVVNAAQDDYYSFNSEEYHNSVYPYQYYTPENADQRLFITPQQSLRRQFVEALSTPLGTIGTAAAGVRNCLVQSFWLSFWFKPCHHICK